ncbi:hypothetical protein M231_05810 [Tremella mesenterica]|uniref:DNA excision repair protein ERCC-5 n=1 Tax=Tremella mesenterica TaxID=5217 RepID=A0A4Q1BH36_TREME|nr:hypothetical protein M231_05810 [Tremella mesenterica]
MGVKGLWSLLNPVARPVQLESLEGKRLAIDSSIWLYQFQATMRDKDGRVLVNAHVLGFLRRINKLLFHGIKPVFVFDGGAPVLKRNTIAERKRRKAGAAANHARMAEKLFAAQMRREAVKAAQSARESRAAREAAASATVAASSRQEESEQIPEGAIYLEDLEGRAGPSSQRPLPSITNPTSSIPPNPPDAAEERRKKFRKHDPYKLPAAEMPTLSTDSRPDARLATEAELQQFIEEIQPNDIDVESAEFRALPTEVQYEIIGDLRIRSRQQSHKRLADMLRAAPSALDFSKAQIKNLSQRNALTQQLLTVTDMVGKAHLTIPVRIAAERNREYVLVKRGEEDGGGWALGIREGAKERPIEVDKQDSEDESDEESEVMDDSDVEEVKQAEQVVAQQRRKKLLDAITARYAPISSPRKSVDVPVKPFGPKKTFGAAPLFEEEDEVQIVVPTANDEALALALQQEELGSDEEEVDQDLARALALSRQEAERQDGSTQMDTREVSDARSASVSSSQVEVGEELGSDDSMEEVSLVPSRPSTPGVITGELIVDEEDDFEEVPTIPIPSQLARVDFSAPGHTNGTKTTTSAMSSIRQTTATVPTRPSVLRRPTEEVIEMDGDGSERVASAFAASMPFNLERRSQPGIVNSSSKRSIPPTSAPQPSMTQPTERDGRARPSSKTQSVVGVSADVPAVRSTLTPPAYPTAPLLSNPPPSIPFASVKPIPPLSTAAPKRPSVNHGNTLDQVPTNKPAMSRTVTESNIQSIASTRDTIVTSTNSDVRSFTGTPTRFDDDGEEEQEQEQEEEEDEEDIIPWSRSPSPIRPLLQPEASNTSLQSLPSEIEPDIEHDSDNGALHPDDIIAETDDYARFLSQIKNRDLAEVQTEIDDEIRVLHSAAKLAARDADEITAPMIAQIQTLLRHFGIPYITAPMEAEAQCAKLATLGLVDGIITDDSDVFLFGGNQCFKNIFNDSKYVECFLSSDIQREISLDRERLISLAYLLGSDYTIGLPGVGPVIALELLSNFPGRRGLEEFKEWWLKVQRGQDEVIIENNNWKERFKKKNKNSIFLTTDWPNPLVREAYLFPETDDSKEEFHWGFPKLSSLRSFLHEELSWSISKVDDELTPIVQRIARRGKSGALNVQSTLDPFFDTSVISGNYAPRKRMTANVSKRLMGVIKQFKEAEARLSGEIQIDQSLSGLEKFDDENEDAHSYAQYEIVKDEINIEGGSGEVGIVEKMEKRGKRRKSSKVSIEDERPTKRKSKGKEVGEKRKTRNKGGKKRGKKDLTVEDVEMMDIDIPPEVEAIIDGTTTTG